jgi:hypothetical protein
MTASISSEERIGKILDEEGKAENINALINAVDSSITYFTKNIEINNSARTTPPPNNVLLNNVLKQSMNTMSGMQLRSDVVNPTSDVINSNDVNLEEDDEYEKLFLESALILATMKQKPPSPQQLTQIVKSATKSPIKSPSIELQTQMIEAANTLLQLKKLSPLEQINTMNQLDKIKDSFKRSLSLRSMPSLSRTKRMRISTKRMRISTSRGQ